MLQLAYTQSWLKTLALSAYSNKRFIDIIRQGGLLFWATLYAHVYLPQEAGENAYQDNGDYLQHDHHH